jgi:hypothetical protein
MNFQTRYECLTSSWWYVIIIYDFGTFDNFMILMNVSWVFVMTL